MTDTPTPSEPAEPAEPSRCENCAAPLHGQYCHACGQSVHSPLRHAGHALEEVFESFWHLDGRIFHTLRDLMVPGRVALGYIAGHRARYAAPLRLFIVLSVLTFFVAQYTIDIDGDHVIVIDPTSGRDTATDTGAKFARARTVAEVERLRDLELADIARARALIPNVVGADKRIDAAAEAIGEQAQRRIAALRREPPAAASATQPVASLAAKTRPPGKRAADGDNPSRNVVAPAQQAIDPSRVEPEVAWDAKANPISISWLPAFANIWLNAMSDRASHNVVLIRKDPQRYFHAAIGTIPTALFVLVPVFALLLKIAYLFKRRLYLEHLVVALYSHAFLLLSLLCIFASMALRGAVGEHLPWLDTVLAWIEGLLLWIGMPMYLLLTQKAVYQQGWPMTLLKYGVVGVVYLVLLCLGVAATFVYSLVRM